MKIMQVAPIWIDTPPKDYGGTELIIHTLSEELVLQGHDVTLFATGNSQTTAKLDFVYQYSLLDQKFPWTSALPSLIHYHQAFVRAEQENFDIVHVHLSSDTDTVMLPLLSQLKIPKVLTVHGLWPFDKHTHTDDLMIEFYAKDIPVVHISKAMFNMQSKKLNAIGYVLNGINIRNFDFDDTPKDYLVWLGKIKHAKGTHEAIMAAKKAGEKLVLAGVIDEHLPKEIQYFEEKVKPYIDGDQIQYLGPANLKMKNDLLGNAKAFLNPIHWEEPFGMVMAESMVTGTPVISFARGAAPELIVDGKTGFLVEETVDAMVDAIKKLDQIKRADCRKHVEDNLSGQKMALEYAKIYEKLIST